MKFAKMEKQMNYLTKAAYDSLVESGCVREKEVRILERDAALAAVLDAVDDETFRDFELNTDAIQRKRFLINQLISCDTRTLAAIYQAHAEEFFGHYIDEAVERLPFGGESDEESALAIDHATRMEDFK